MHGSQTVDSLDQNAPYLTFTEVHFALFPIIDHLKQVASICDLHHQAKKYDKQW